MNGHASQNGTTSRTQSERTRLEDRPNISVAELAAMQRGYVERLGKLIEQLSTVMSRQIPPTAAIGSAAPTHGVASTARSVHSRHLDTLARTPLPGGDISYSVRNDAVRSTVAKVLGAARPAFVERAAATPSPYIELVGTSNAQIFAAMAFAARRWGNDEVVIHASGKHTAKIIAHAVAQGLNIANRDSYIQALVAQERARQSNAPSERGQRAASPAIAVIERAESVRRSR